MSKRSKRMKKLIEIAPKQPLTIREAIQFLKEHSTVRFDETLELAFVLGIDVSKSDQQVRDVVKLPYGTGKNIRVLVFATGENAEKAKAAGADYVGLSDLTDKIQKGWTDFDVAIAVPEVMNEVKKLGKILGPRGIMPNPKTGTVTEDVVSAVKESKAGRVEFRADRSGNVHVPFGKVSFPVEHLEANAKAVISAVMAAKPPKARGKYIKKCVMSSTMGVGIKINLEAEMVR